jgi:MFS transporter, MHS family, shikimate and dehydroshikimate transport protein
VLAGGLAPLIATALLAWLGSSAVAAYVTLMALITVVSTYLASETFQGEISEDETGAHKVINSRPAGNATDARGP